MNNHIEILDNIIEILLIYRQEINKNKIENKSEEMILLENDLSNIEDSILNILSFKNSKNEKIKKKIDEHIESCNQIRQMMPIILQAFLIVNS